MSLHSVFRGPHGFFHPLSLLTGLFIFCCASGCNQQNAGQYLRIQGKTMGTTYRITYFHPTADTLQQQVDSLLNQYLRSVSTYEPKSTISRFNQNPRGVKMDTTFQKVYMASREIYEATQGAFDPTVGPLVNLWGFGYKELPKADTATVDSMRKLVGFDNLKVKGDSLLKPLPDMELDFSAIAKGYGVDLVAEMLEAKGIEHYFVEIGGEIRMAGKNPSGGKWRAGIERPKENSQGLKAILSTTDQALATSGNYRNFYYRDGERYAHTIDPTSGYPVEHNLLSASVVASSCMYADAYATAFMVMGRGKTLNFLNNRPEIEAFLIYEDEAGKLITYSSPGIKRKIKSIEESALIK